MLCKAAGLWQPVVPCNLVRTLVRRKHKRRDEVTEQHISLLLNCGLLTRHLTQKDTYWFALAGIGPLIKSLVKGRKVSFLLRRCMTP